MKRLTIIGRVATPAAMVVFMTYEISRSMAVTGGWLVAIVVGAAATAVGIEVVGILSGHALETSWRVGDQWRALLAFALLLIYTVGAVYILRRNDTIMPVPIIAAIVYVVAALVDGLERHVAQEETAVSKHDDFDLEQKRLNEEAERRLKAQAQADKTAVKLAQIEAKAKAPATYQRQEARQEVGNLPDDWRQLTDQQRYDLAHTTRDKREDMFPELADRTRRLWHERLDEIAMKNGGYLQVSK